MQSTSARWGKGLVPTHRRFPLLIHQTYFLNPVSLPFVSVLFQAFFSLLTNSHLPKWPWQSLGGARKNSSSWCWVLLVVHPRTHFLLPFLSALCSLAALSPYPFNDSWWSSRGQFSAISYQTLVNFAFFLYPPFLWNCTLVYWSEEGKWSLFLIPVASIYLQLLRRHQILKLCTWGADWGQIFTWYLVSACSCLIQTLPRAPNTAALSHLRRNKVALVQSQLPLLPVLAQANSWEGISRFFLCLFSSLGCRPALSLCSGPLGFLLDSLHSSSLYRVLSFKNWSCRWWVSSLLLRTSPWSSVLLCFLHSSLSYAVWPFKIPF